MFTVKLQVIFFAKRLLVLVSLLPCMGNNVVTYNVPTLDSRQIEALQVLRVFHQRAAYGPLTEEQLQQLSDEELLYAAFEQVSAGVSVTPGRELETLSRLTIPQQTIYVLWLLQSDMQIGGLRQFYFNTSREIAALAPAAFSRIGAEALASFLQYANGYYQDSVDMLLADTTSIAADTFQDHIASGIEARYRLLWDREGAQRRLVAFIRRHLRDFAE